MRFCFARFKKKKTFYRRHLLYSLPVFIVFIRHVRNGAVYTVYMFDVIAVDFSDFTRPGTSQQET